MTKTFANALQKVTEYAQSIGFIVEERSDLDEFFKGDLDGKHIWIADDLDDEEKLFNLLHLIGHNIQWNINQDFFELGSVLYKNPDEKIIARLYAYEWDANCYAMYILQYLGFKNLRSWLYDMFKEDINYLIMFYRTGEKIKIMPEERIPPVELIPKSPPLYFEPKQMKQSRNGIVI